jgi:membrane fusion protein (multidrug efflux system)
MRIDARGTKLLILLLAMVVVACEDSTEERVANLTVPVTDMPVGLGTIEAKVDSTGSLLPLREAELIAEVKGDLFLSDSAGGGRLEEGSRVTAGDLVARIESEEWLVSVRQESRELAVENARRALADKQALFEEGLGIETDVDNARKVLIDAQADLENARIQVEKMQILAPISGFLTELADITDSTLVQQNAVIGKIVDYSRVLVDLNIPNSQINAVRRGQPVRITNYAFPDRLFEGVITIMDPALNPTTRTFRVEATVNNADMVLRPGMFVRAEIVTESREGVVIIPRELILNRQNRQVVFVVQEGAAEMREITTGLEDEMFVEVLEGLSEGERLITSNYETLRSRTAVQVTGQSGPGR